MKNSSKTRQRIQKIERSKKKERYLSELKEKTADRRLKQPAQVEYQQ